MKIKYRPQAAWVATPDAYEAWWYEHRGRIDIVVRPDAGPTVMVRIRRSLLADYISRTTPKHRRKQGGGS